MAQKITEVKATTVQRITTTIFELDWMYGFTGNTWGLPAGKMSLWAGEKGTGKSRAAIEVCRTVARHQYPGWKGQPPFKYKVLYFQREVDLSTLAGWVQQDGGVMPPNFYVSRANTVETQIREIRQVRPHVVVVDSINMVKDFRGNSEEKIEMAIEGDGKGSLCYRDICKECNCHIIFLCQLTKAGQARGSSSIAHLLDVEMILKKNGPDGFSIACPQKNRYGKTGSSSWWIHTRHKAYAESSFRLEDEDWCRTHGLIRRDISAEGEIFRQQLIKDYAAEQITEQEAEIAAARAAYFGQMTTMQKFGRWFIGLDTE